MRTLRSTVARLGFLPLVISLVAALAACDPTGLIPSAGRCRVKFAQPYRPQVTTTRLVRGQASAVCTGPVDRHHVELDLQVRTGVGWATREQDTSDAIPYPQAVDLLVVTECRAGTWRLLYDVTASAQGQSDHKSDASDSLTVTSPQDCQVPR